MFKQITISLDGPICQCTERNLAWGPFADKDGKFGLKVWCRTCDTALWVPNSQFGARFDLAKEYPEGVKTENEAEKKKKEALVEEARGAKEKVVRLFKEVKND